MVLVEIWQLIHVFILGKIVQGNVFQDSLERKKHFSRLLKQQVKNVKKVVLFQRG